MTQVRAPGSGDEVHLYTVRHDWFRFPCPCISRPNHHYLVRSLSFFNKSTAITIRSNKSTTTSHPASPVPSATVPSRLVAEQWFSDEDSSPGRDYDFWEEDSVPEHWFDEDSSSGRDYDLDNVPDHWFNEEAEEALAGSNSEGQERNSDDL